MQKRIKLFHSPFFSFPFLFFFFLSISCFAQNAQVMSVDLAQNTQLRESISVSGKILLEREERLVQGENDLNIETSTLSAGLYFLQLRLGQNDYAVLKFVIL